MQDTRRQTQGGFTLIELLVVISIVALLIAILSVGSKKVKVISKNLQQKSAFHAMEVGLELFSGDFDGYPSSKARVAGGYYVTGAQHLAEAMLGRDGRGFEPQTGWFPLGDVMFSPNAPADLYRSVDASLLRRKGPYCELKYGEARTIRQLWGGNNGPSGIYDTPAAATNAQISPIMTDVFSRNDTPSGNLGMPILYFKADSTKRFRVDAARQTVTNPGSADYQDWVYNFDDNLPIIQLPWLRDTAVAGAAVHYRDPDDAAKTQAQVFYEQITQQEDSTRHYYKPYNGSTFLLISAGWDGIYGTKDDIVNFD